MFMGSAIKDFRYHFNQGFDIFNFHFKLDSCTNFSHMMQLTGNLEWFSSDFIYALTPKIKTADISYMFFNTNPSFEHNFDKWYMDMDAKMNYFYGNTDNDYSGTYNAPKLYYNMQLLDTDDEIPDTDTKGNKLTWVKLFDHNICVIL